MAFQMQRPLPHLAGSGESAWLTAAGCGASVPWEGLRRGPVPAAMLSPARAEWFLTLTSGSGGFFLLF